MALNFPINPELDDTYTSGGNTWKWNGTVWNIISAQYDTGIGGIPTDLADLTDTTGLIPESILDLGIEDGSDGQVLTTDGIGGFTFTTVSGGDGGGATTLGDLEDVTIDAVQTGEVLKWDGTQWTNDTDATGGGGGGATTFVELTDVPVGLTVDQIYEPAIAMYRMDNDGTIAYTIESHYAGNNPSIVCLSGTTIAFNLSGISGHPLEIQNAVGNPYNTGLVHVDTDGTVSVGALAQGKDRGTLYWRIQESISGTYRYQCQVHSGMVGNITVKRLSVV